MKVLLVCKALHFTYKGGIQTHVWELSQALVALGMEVDILIGGKPVLRTVRRSIAGRNLIELPTLPGYRLKYFAKTLDGLAFNVQVVRWLSRHASEYDIIHFHGRSGLVWSVVAPGKLSNCLLTLHGLIREEYQCNRKSMDRWLHTRIFGWIERLAVNRLPVVVAVSRDEQLRIENQFDRPLTSIQVIPNGVDGQIQAFTKPPTGRKWIIFAGRMERVKGVDLLPDILMSLPEEIGLFMVGAGPEREVLEQEFEKKELTHRVVWTGAIAPNEVFTYMDKSLVLVLPSRYEPQGRVVLEAMSKGRPVVAGRVGGIPEMITDGVEGILVDEPEAAAYSAAINRILIDPERAMQMGKWGRERVRSAYSWDRLGREMLTVYKELIQKSEHQMV